MKNIKTTKETWRKIRQIKNQQGLNNFSKTIEYLINSQPDDIKESLQEIQNHVDEIKPTLEGITKKQSVIKIQCMQCSSSPFELNESVCNETGIVCPFCKHIHAIVIQEGQLPQPKSENLEGVSLEE